MDQFSANTNTIWWDDLTDDEFIKHFKMSRNTFIYLQAELDATENREADRIDKKLLTLVWLLGNTASLDEAAQLFKLKDISNDIQFYCKKIVALNPKYLTWPTEDEANEIADNFKRQFGFSDTVGVIGSLYIEVKGKDALEINYFNVEMQKHVVVLQIVCDSYLLIRDVCVGYPGSQSVCEIFKSSPLFKKLSDPNSYLVKNEKHLLGGYKHPELKTLLTPYDLSSSDIIHDELIQYNAAHERMMTTVEKTFHLLETRFPRISSVDCFSPSIASLIIGTSCVLHNFVRMRNDVLI